MTECISKTGVIAQSDSQPGEIDLSIADRQKYKHWLQQENTSILTVTRHGHLTYMSPFGLDFFGFDWPSLAGRHVVGTVVPEIETGGRDLTKIIQNLGENPDFYVTCINENICANGERVWIAWHNAPVLCSDGTSQAILSIGQNISGFNEKQDDMIFSQYALDHVDEAFLWMDRDGRLIYANAATSQILQYSRQQLLTMSIFEIDMMSTRQDWPRRQALTQKAFETLYKRQDGQPIPVEINANLLSYRGQEYICCSARDITRHRLNEKKLQCEKHKLQEMITYNPLAISVFGVDGKAQGTNEKGRELFGDVPLEAYRWSMSSDFNRCFERAKQGKVTPIPEHWVNPHDTHPMGRDCQICLRTVLFPVCGADGVENVVAMHEDVSQRRWLENKLLTTSEHEQEKISQELHDGLGQKLTGLALLSKALQKRLALRAPEEAEAAGQLVELANETLGECRKIARGHSLLDLKSLRDGLLDLAENAKGCFALECQCHLEESDMSLDPSVRMHLYRIAQEALCNAAKHSNATRVDIHLDVLDAELKRYALWILDNGCGFSPEACPGKGIGLHIMKHRAEMIGAKLTICRGPEGGTLVRCCFMNHAIPDVPLARDSG
jgi:PAS domain S-box-containing protein